MSKRPQSPMSILACASPYPEPLRKFTDSTP